MALKTFALLFIIAQGSSLAALPPARLAPFPESPARSELKAARISSSSSPAGQRKRAGSKQTAKKRYEAAPEIVVIGLDGMNIRLSEKRGKVLVIDFWASWCPPCRGMIPIFNSIHNKYNERGLEVIGVSMDEGTTADLKKLSSEFGLRYTAADGDRETEEAFGVKSLPTTLLIDRRGRIRLRHSGALGQAKLEREIKRLLAE